MVVAAQRVDQIVLAVPDLDLSERAREHEALGDDHRAHGIVLLLERTQTLAALHVPDLDHAVRAAAHNLVAIDADAVHDALVATKCRLALAARNVPHLDRGIGRARDERVIIARQRERPYGSRVPGEGRLALDHGSGFARNQTYTAHSAQ